MGAGAPAIPRLRLLLACVLAAALPALAFEPFVIKDIRVEGVQRTEAGTVFTYLPVKVGERVVAEGMEEKSIIMAKTVKLGDVAATAKK